MHGVTQVFIASPALMALAMFSGTLCHCPEPAFHVGSSPKSRTSEQVRDGLGTARLRD
jgi:hypothetical protein